MDNLNDYIKEAFEYKSLGDYKKAIDYFYKALAIENDSVEIMFELAQLYFILAQNDRALSLYEQIIAKNPENNDIKLQYAQLLKQVKNYAKAEQIFLELFEDDYELRLVGAELFEIYLLTGNFKRIIDTFNTKYNTLSDSIIFYYVGIAYERLGNEQLAQSFYRKSYDSDENNSEAAGRIARTLVESGDFEEAEQICLKLLKNSENDKIFAIIAELYMLKNDYDSAMKYFSFAIRLNDKNSEYYFKLGLVYTLKGYFNEAEESYSCAIDLEPENLTYKYSLAYLYYTINKFENSEKLTDTILMLEPNYISAISLKILLLLKQDKASDCSKYIKILNDIADKDDFSYFAIAEYYAKLNMWDASINAINKAIEKNGNSTEYKYELAHSLYCMGKYEEALEICKKITQDNDKYIEAYILQAEIYLKLNDYLNAQENTQKAALLDGNNYDIYSLSGRIYKNRCSWKKAIENFKIAISIRPNITENYSYTGYCYYQLKDYETSYEYYKEASEIDIENADNHYYMAKCAQNMEQNENALAHYSVMYRLAQGEVEYITDYAMFLASINKKKNAVNILKTLQTTTKNKEQKEKIKINLDKIKNNF
ncbi:tetratricopeptide repeat protein [bacterium]|nr:tetratricopeptide repeat protein [bacterium]